MPENSPFMQISTYCSRSVCHAATVTAAPITPP